MTTVLWVVLTPIALGLLALGIWLLKVIVPAVVEGWREGMHGDGSYELPEAAAALGLLPPERQNTKLASPEPAAVTAAVSAARTGDWKPAAALLEEIGRNWAFRAFVCGRLAEYAAEEDTWLLAWEAARPDDPDAAVVRARSTVFLAWRIRGGKRAQYTAGEQFDGFHRTLARSREENARAAALNPDDPTPYISEIWTALGLGYPHAAMDRIWSELTARAPHLYEAHYSAMQYWCAKWRGSEKLARDFAARAAAGAPLGSLLKVLPLIAHYEHDESDDTAADTTPEMHAIVDAALADTAAADPDHPRLAEARHLLAYYLLLQDRYEASVEQFRLVDGYVGALPWRYRSDAAEYYCGRRDIAVAGAAEAAGTTGAATSD
ncbi:hypothetical protein [Streptomyces sp. FIT100]|uniref:hypothetical protein n=1 Tax=Streptomyces sp. FIT100 TaxID=2837956 RepID=UPI0021C9789E|nr:hypothetical protein [Streptomyces sp. FIT100]UUN28856.1 hypothetical protein KK483_22575 [Streptomyces sp. FIT100]